jgi:hypothetical protein
MRSAAVICLISCIAVGLAADAAVEQRNPMHTHAVALGYPVTFSSAWNGDHRNYFLDIDMSGGAQSGSQACSWSSGYNNKDAWWKVTAPRRVHWTGLTTKGRCVDSGNNQQWVTSYAVDSTNNGVDWTPVDGGKIFTANSDGNTPVTNMFSKPVKALALRVRPQSWNNHISMRFEVYHK